MLVRHGFSPSASASVPFVDQAFVSSAGNHLMAVLSFTTTATAAAASLSPGAAPRKSSSSHADRTNAAITPLPDATRQHALARVDRNLSGQPLRDLGRQSPCRRTIQRQRSRLEFAEATIARRDRKS